MGKAYRIDKEIRAMIPALSPEERQQLEENIVAEGSIRDPGVVWEGILLDGHNRHDIAEQHFLDFRVNNIDLPDRETALLWVADNQLGRRNLNDFQRVEVALKRKAIYERLAEAKIESARHSPKSAVENRKSSKGKEQKLASHNCDEPNMRTDEAIGEVAGVSRGTVRKVESIIESATPTVAEMARTGEVSVSAAATVAELPKKEQRAIAAKGPKAVKAKATEMRAKPKEAKPLVDGEGNPVPDELREVFRNARKFDELLNLFTQITKGANAIMGSDPKHPLPGSEDFAVRRQRFDTDLANARTEMGFARPFAPCPYPHSKDGKCNACRGLGWVVKDVLRDAPRDLKKSA